MATILQSASTNSPSTGGARSLTAPAPLTSSSVWSNLASKPAVTSLPNLAANQYASAAKTTTDALSRGSTNIAEGFGKANNATSFKDNLSGVGQIAVGAGESAVGSTAGFLQALFAPVTATVQRAYEADPARQQGTPDMVAGVKIQPTATSQAIQAWTQAHPAAASDLQNLASTVLGGAGGEAGILGKTASEMTVGEGASALKSVGSDAVQGVKNTAGAVANPRAALGAALAGTPEKQLAAITKDWTAATPTTKAGFKNARAVLANSPSTPDFLAKQGLTPSAHVVDGHFVTQDAADTLHETANQLSHETLRPSLQMADYATPKTPVSEVISDAVKNVTSDKSNITEGDKAKIISNINSEGEALKAKFPDGMSLTDMHDNKITYAKNGGYSPIKPAADNNLATANRSIASSLQKTVEDKAPESVPVKPFNQYLSQYHKAGDYLTALNTKMAPVTLGQQVARAGAKLTGAVVGAHLGGLPAEFAGYQVGKALEHAVENLTGSTRTEFLNNLEKTNNPAFQKVQQFLRDKNAGSPGQAKLPAATNKSPIPMGAPKDTSIKAPYAAKAGYPLARDPKTGKIMKTFTSQSQSETPLERSQPQASAPATSKTNTIGQKPTIPTGKVQPPKNAGFIANPVPKTIHTDDLRQMKDFTDYVAGDYKPSPSETHALELSASRMFEHYFPAAKMPKTLQGIANKFGTALDKNASRITGPNRDASGKFSK